jgi:F-type H+-transporting ATPase subunit b
MRTPGVLASALVLAACLVLAASPRAQHATDSHGHASDGHATGLVDAAAQAGHADEHAAGEAHHGPNYVALAVNFAVFAGALVYFLRKPMKSFFAERKAGIAQSFAAAEAARRDTAARMAELDARLAALDAQVQDILTRAAEQAAAERDVLLEAARAEAARLLAQAEAQVSDLESESVRRLKVVAAELSVEVARDIIEKQLAPEDRSRFFERTLKGLQKATP